MELRQHTRGAIGLFPVGYAAVLQMVSSCPVAADEVLACNGFSERCMDAYQNQTEGTVSYACSRALLLHTQSGGTCQQGSGKAGQFIILLQFAQLHTVISGCSVVLCPSFHFFALCFASDILSFPDMR
jgi:hypothetical protein